jgi:asparagine synthase (glutamine-hydrolysing)
MCGIAGILTHSGNRQEIEEQILPMQAALRHRGPDSEGIYVSDDRTVALAHTRLSILDLSSAGHQPMSVDRGRYWITFNGEIYNFKELRRDLENEGEQFYSQTDTEVILRLYQRFGKSCVDRLRGMFVFAIWDNLEKSCFLARDSLGIKPLYYWQSNSTFLFASEIRAIIASRLLSISLNPEGLYSYLINGTVTEPLTLIQGINCLEAGNWLHWQAGKLTQQQYWQIKFTPEPISPSEAKEKVRNALIDSIEHHFVSDVPVGMFLSGGIDSTSLVALARQSQTGKLRTYSIAFEESKFNEGDLAKKTAEEFATDHTEYTITSSLGLKLFEQYLEKIDQPSVDGFNTFCVSQVASQDGTKVVLSGLGGDELFGGYQSFQKVPQMVRFSQKLQPLHPLRNCVGMALECWGKSPKIKRLGDFLQQTPTTTSAYRSLRGIFSHQEACHLMDRYFFKSIPVKRKNDCNEDDFTSVEDRVSWLELNYYMRNQLLRDSDVMSMAWGLELRVPLVDRILLETIASIPSHIRLAPGKKLLVEAVPELPAWVINRPKQGFYFPFETWIDTTWNKNFSDFKLPKNISLKPWYRRWSLVLLQSWWKQIQN